MSGNSIVPDISALTGASSGPAPQDNFVQAPADASAGGPPPGVAAGDLPGVTPMATQSPTAIAAGNTPQPAAAPSAAAKPGAPHAGLVNILQGLFLGMDSFAKAAATGGREGGVQEVNAVHAQQADQALKQQAAGREQKMADASIQHMQALTNATIAQTEINKINAPLEHQKLVISNQDALYDLYVNKLHINPLFAVPIVQGQTTDTHMAGINAKANGDLVNNTVIPVHDDTVGGNGNSYGFSFDQLRKVNVPIEQAGPVLANLQNQINFAKSVLPDGEKDPAIQAAQGKLDVLKKGSTINGYDFFTFDNAVQSQILARVNNQQAVSDYNKKAAEAKEAQQKADPLFKLENDPNEMAGEKSAAAIPLLQNKITDPATAPADRVRATRLLAQAQQAHAAFQQDQLQKANAEQQAKQGDPAAAGALLANGDLTLTDMKTRGMTPKFIEQAVGAAKKVDPAYRPADEIAAEKVANSPEQNKFFGSANSLINKGGTLDQVVTAGATLPNNKVPIFNKLEDAKNYATGHPEVAAYMQTALGAADDYAKVLGGGAGTEGMQLHILNGLTAAQNQDQRVAVVNAMKKSVYSQVESRIGENKFLNRMYGGSLPQNQKPAAAAAPAMPKGATMKVPGSDGKLHWSDGKVDLGVAQ